MPTCAGGRTPDLDVKQNTYRAKNPGDVIPTRKGLHIEIGNTDAEGRVVLSDALAYAAEAKPELIIDLATLTGAARVALGAQLPALFAKHHDTARDLVDLGLKMDDPLWHMPLWAPYRAGIESTIGDIVNTGKSALAGAINAALFLEYFVPDNQDWLHIDLFALPQGQQVLPVMIIADCADIGRGRTLAGGGDGEVGGVAAISLQEIARRRDALVEFHHGFAIGEDLLAHVVLKRSRSTQERK